MGESHRGRQITRANMAVGFQASRESESGWIGTLDPRDSVYVGQPADRNRRGPYPKRSKTTEIILKR